MKNFQEMNILYVICGYLWSCFLGWTLFSASQPPHFDLLDDPFSVKVEMSPAEEDAYGDEICHHLPLHPKGAVWARKVGKKTRGSVNMTDWASWTSSWASKMDIATPELPSGDSSYSCNSRIILTSVQGKDRPLQSKILTNNLFWLVVLKCFKHFCVVHPSKDDYPIICFHIFGRQGPPQPLKLTVWHCQGVSLIDPNYHNFPHEQKIWIRAFLKWVYPNSWMAFVRETPNLIAGWWLGVPHLGNLHIDVYSILQDSIFSSLQPLRNLEMNRVFLAQNSILLGPGGGGNLYLSVTSAPKWNESPWVALHPPTRKIECGFWFRQKGSLSFFVHFHIFFVLGSSSGRKRINLHEREVGKCSA